MNGSARPVLDDISVIIPTLGRPTLRNTLQSIADGSHWPAALIVSQQGEETAPVAWIDELRARGLNVIHEHNPDERGVATGRNRGTAHVSTDFLCLTDDDCVVDEDWLITLRDQLIEHQCVIVGSVHPDSDELVPSTLTRPEPRVTTEPSYRYEPFFPNNTGYPRSVPDQIGGFDEDPRIRFAEDGDYSYRILRAGIPIRYEPSVRISHAAWRSESQLDKVFDRYAWCIGAMYGKWIRRGDRYMTVRAIRDVARIPWWIVRGKATGNVELSVAGRRYARKLVPGLLAGLRTNMDEADIAILH